MQSPEQLAQEKIDHSRVYSTNQISLSQLLWHHEKRPEEAMTDSLDIRNSTFGLCPIQRLYSMLRRFFFWIETRMPQGQPTRGDRQGEMRIQRTVCNALLS